jgi:cytochrome c peroxidase
MKKPLLFVLPVVAAVAISATIDLGNLENYSKQVVPAYIVKDNTPPNNQLDDKGATLGRVLFYDKKLSVNNTTACASCHQQQYAFSDIASASQGALGTTGRHAMRLINARFAGERRFFWDERAASLEEQTTQPIQNHEEMGYSGQNGDPSLNDLITKMSNTWYYPQLFTWAYGTPVITEARMQQALAKFIRSIQSFDSKFDIGRAMVGNDGQPFPNFTAQENQGKQLFLAPPQFDANGNRVAGGAGCGGCHNPSEFDIAPNSRNNGVTGSFAGPADLTNTRSPSLHDVVDANGNSFGGFMHNAGANGLNTLMDVINHYDSIKADNANLDPRLRPGGNLAKLHLTMQEKTALVAFIRTLTGSDVYTNAKWSSPFTGDSLTITNTSHVPQQVITATIKVYPTVTTSELRFDIPSSLSQTKMLIVNMSGHVLYNGMVTNRLDISSYPAGMYYVRFEKGQTEKVVKQ